MFDAFMRMITSVMTKSNSELDRYIYGFFFSTEDGNTDLSRGRVVWEVYKKQAMG